VERFMGHIKVGGDSNQIPSEYKDTALLHHSTD
jgi:hypothetical protein